MIGLMFVLLSAPQKYADGVQYFATFMDAFSVKFF